MGDFFQSFNGAYEFNPAMLIQRRPPYSRENLLLAGQLSLHHERAHWFQFAGSTVGAVLLTLHRAEEITLLRWFTEGDLEAAAVAHVQECLRRNKALRARAGVVPHQIRNLVDTFTELRLSRLLLTDSVRRSQLPRPPGELLADALVTADHTYAIHTGGRRHWGPWAARTAHRRGLLDPKASLVGERELTTRHVMEAGAFLNQWSLLAAGGWGEGPPVSGARYQGLSVESRYILMDAFGALTQLYRLCFDFAFDRWQDRFRGQSECDTAGHFARALPALACCFDIALNPPVLPLCVPSAISWEELYPPHRFMAAVEAVGQVGLLDEFPGNASYADYRDRVCGQAELVIGHSDRRSFQHDRFSAPFFKSVESGDPILEKLSYFDYLIWVMESFDEFRRTNPLHWAMPSLNYIAFDGRDVLSAIIGEFSLVATTPMQWTGDDFSWGVLSEAAAASFVIEKSVLHCMKEAVVTSGTIDLPAVLPLELLRHEGFQKQVLGGLEATTGLPEFGSRAIGFGDDEETPPVSPVARDIVKPLIRREREVFIVRREEVERLDFARIDDFFAALRAAPLDNVRSVDLRFDSYQAHGMELWRVDAVTTYLREMAKRHPSWPWYLTAGADLENCAGLVLIFLSGAQGPERLTKEYLLEWLIAVTGDPLVMEGERAGVDRQFLTDLTNDVAEALMAIWTMRFD
ncbi:hypothetical protein J5Y04_27990 [Kitasatospora sp. RG8]|uniref:hypothetical protein n=1 Tax=Kitasatospora sp. RG8 TaxID=2820815 RepID=UPI001ADEF47D|nr:hypothetical protein [Kitasatospora sp. RG8]MBP0453357.1 hypothetical protein [Kitasatospora sp. RG8]